MYLKVNNNNFLFTKTLIYFKLKSTSSIWFKQLFKPFLFFFKSKNYIQFKGTNHKAITRKIFFKYTLTCDLVVMQAHVTDTNTTSHVSSNLKKSSEPCLFLFKKSTRMYIHMHIVCTCTKALHGLAANTKN